MCNNEQTANVSVSSVQHRRLGRVKIDFLGQQLAYPIRRPVLDMTDDVTQPHLHLYVFDFIRANQQVQDRRPFTATIRSGEQPAFAIQCDISQCVLCDIAVDFAQQFSQ